MITVKQILEWPIGYRSGGYQLFIKTCKKKYQVKATWFQRLMLTDGTDEILAEINLGTSPMTLFRSMPITIVIGERTIRDVNNRDVPALYIDQWRDDRPKMSEPEELDDLESWRQAREKEIEGKIRHGLCCAFIRGYTHNHGFAPQIDKASKEMIVKWHKFIETGE